MDERCEIGFGPHLTMDLYGCDKSVLNDEKFVHNFLNELPDLIGMHKISQPQITKYPGRQDSFDKGGISAFILIAESHITLHTFIAQNHAFIDIFSCRDFDIEKAEKYIRKKFRPARIHKNLFPRGIEFPRNVEVVKEIVAGERKRGRK
ncbi:MAG: adenosylmethionine decarboxylase [Candidatus Aenigmarchaeota archaeon]|nr:adenosylmethionine decarboxylase [Candidatus Aenigmarchaeota archaeon]